MVYSSISACYDRIFPLNPDILRFMSDCMSSSDSVLDIGCGTGTLTNALKPFCRSIIGIDVSPEMIRMGKAKYLDLQLIQTDIDGLDEEFDVIYSTGNTVSYFSRCGLEHLAASVCKHLRPGGFWIYQTVNWDFLIHADDFEFPSIDIGDAIFYRSYTFASDKDTDFRLVIRSKDGDAQDITETHRIYRFPRSFHIEVHTRAGLVLSDGYLSWNRTKWVPDRQGATILVFRKPLITRL